MRSAKLFLNSSKNKNALNSMDDWQNQQNPQRLPGRCNARFALLSRYSPGKRSMLLVQAAEGLELHCIRWIHSVFFRAIQSMLDSDQALNLLKQLDQRQEQILTDIDALNERIQALLTSYQANRTGNGDSPIQKPGGSTTNGIKPVPDRRKAA